MVQLETSLTSSALGVIGGYVIIVGLVSFKIKERLYLSETLVAFAAGIIFGPLAANIFSPLDWCGGDHEKLNRLTYQITRIVIAIQVLFTGIALRDAYLWRVRKSLFVLLFPVMTAAWMVTSLLVWAMIPNLTFLETLVIGACVTPTDPVLANAICKGRFAEKYLPRDARDIIVAESAANDGLGYPFLFLPLYLILIHEPTHPWHTVGGAIAEWIYNILLFEILLSVILGAFIGYVARKVLKYCEQRQTIDHESFLAYGVGLTFFTLGTVGSLGSDDLLACFAAGASFTWFRAQTEEHAFQDVIDQLINSAIFIYIGSIMPWHEFGNFWDITPWRLVVLGILVILLRRLPWVLLLSHFIPSLPTWKDAMFAGYFGPMGVGAIFYTQAALEYIPDNGTRDRLRGVILPVVYFLVMTSIIVHGITIPIGKGFSSARSLTLTRSTGATNANIISRLPPAQPYPAPIPAESDKSTPTLAGGDTVRFEETPRIAEHSAANSDVNTPGVQWVDLPRSGRNSAAVSGTTTPVSVSRTGTPVPSTPVRGASHHETPLSGIIKRTMQSEPVLDSPV